MGSHTPLYWSSTTPDLRVPLPARNLTPLIMGPTIYTHVHIKWITAHNKVILTVKLISFPKSHIINLLEIMSNIYIKKKIKIIRPWKSSIYKSNFMYELTIDYMIFKTFSLFNRFLEYIPMKNKPCLICVKV